MRELVIVLTDLFLPAAAEPAAGPAANAAPGLAWLARFAQRQRATTPWTDWLAGELCPGATGLPAPAQLAALSADRPAGAASFIASPLHLQAGLTDLHADLRSLLRLAPGEAGTLAADFAAAFGSAAAHLEALPDGTLLLEVPGAAGTRTVDPARAIVDGLRTSQPQGAGGVLLRRLASELEMWLHAHPLNAARRERRQPAVSALWPWGNAGAAAPDDRPAAANPGSVQPAAAASAGPAAAVRMQADEAVGRGLARVLGAECVPLADRPASHFGYPRAGREALVLAVAPLLDPAAGQGGGAATDQNLMTVIDRLSLLPAVQALERGAIDRLAVRANDIVLRAGRWSGLRRWRVRRAPLAALLAC